MASKTPETNNKIKKGIQKNIHEGHRERLRQRFLKEGLDGFQPHNVLELLLFYSIPVKDTNEEGIYKLQAAATCVDNNSGFVVAIVGGREEE